MNLGTPALHLEKFSLSYGKTPVLTLPKFIVQRSEIVGLVGLSGAGKTSLLRWIADGDGPGRGQLTVDGLPVDRRVRRQRISRTIQSFPLMHHLTVLQIMRLASRFRRVPDVDISASLDLCKAAHLASKYPGELSGGERCRVSLAAALLGNPRVLLLDEPFNGLDAVVKAEVAMSMLSSARSLGCGVVLVTHDLHDAASFCDRSVVLKGREPSMWAGEVASDTPEASRCMYSLLKGIEGDHR